MAPMNRLAMVLATLFFLSAGPVKVAASPQAAVPGVKVTGKVVNVAKEWTILAFRTILLTSTTPGGPTIEVPVNPDYTFEFAKVPAGVFRASVRGLPEGSSIIPTVTVSGDDIAGVNIDLRNNPFPEYPGGAYSPVFDSRIQVTVIGVVTQALTQIRPPAPTLFFRMDVKDEQTGAVTPWAVTLTTRTPPATLTDTLKLTVGSSVNVAGTGSRDKTNRISVDNVGPTTGRINGKTIPNLSSP